MKLNPHFYKSWDFFGDVIKAIFVKRLVSKFVENIHLVCTWNFNFLLLNYHSYIKRQQKVEFDVKTANMSDLSNFFEQIILDK